mmetsp:Transcript_29733/g.95138  ORF Transcript_29733/g.95138 Transcript_29733/m.95138 type:complete len:216 (+) Transcript_29733:1423-2070(+)
MAIVHLSRQRTVAFTQDEINLVERGGRCHAWLFSDICSASNRASFPRQQVQHSSILREPNAAHAIRREMIWKDKMRSLGRHNNLLHFWVCHLANGISERPRRIDHLFRLDIISLSGENVTYFGAGDLVVLISRFSNRVEAKNFSVIHDLGAGLSGSERNVQVHAGIVLLSIIQHKSCFEAFALQMWELKQSFCFGDQVTFRNNRLGSSYGVIQLS